MGKRIENGPYDALLAYIADNGGRMDLCAGEPTTYTEATDTNSLGNTTVTTGDGNGDYTIADGDTSGRKVDVAAQNGVSIGTSGTADHVAVTDGTSELLKVTTCPDQAVTSGNTADIAGFKTEVADPS